MSLAKTFTSAVTLIHVMQPPRDSGSVHAHDAIAWEIGRQEIEGFLERVRTRMAAELSEPVDVRIEQGRAAERIADVARELSADLTILGSHGEGIGTAWSIGSTAQAVLARAPTSVFVAHGKRFAEQEGSPKRILVPLDGSRRAETVMPLVLRLAHEHKAEVILVHIVQEPIHTALLHTKEDNDLLGELAVRLERGAKEYLNELKKTLVHDVDNVRTIITRHANQQQALLEIAQRESADLVVLSAHGSACDASRSFGTLTSHLLTYSSVPLLVLQDLPDSELSRAQESRSHRSSPPPRTSYAPENV